MSKANNKARFFTKRGEKDVTFDFNGEEVGITIVIPTNYQHDKLVEEFTEVTRTGEMDIRGADLVEARLMNFITDLSFEIPLDENMEEFGSWVDANEDQRRIAIQIMDSDLRDKINTALIGKSMLSEETMGN